MNDLGSFNVSIQNYLNIIIASDKSLEEKQEAIEKVKKLQNQAKAEFENELDVNHDGVITQKEYEDSKAYIDYLHLSTIFDSASKGINLPNQVQPQTGAREIIDVDGDGKISTLEYQAQLHSTTQEDGNNRSVLSNFLGYITELQNEKQLTSPQDLVKEINIRIRLFEQELSNGQYSSEEIEKYIQSLNNAIAKVKSEISISYDRQYMANHIDSQRKENRDNKNEFLGLMAPLLSKYQSIVNELKSTHPNAVNESSYILVSNINRIRTVANGDDLLDSGFTMRRINKYIEEILNNEQKNAFLGTDINKYLSKETAELIKNAILQAKEQVLAKLNENYQNAGSVQDIEAIQNLINEYTNNFDNLISKYQNLSDNAVSREPVYSIPEEIKPLYDELGQCETTAEKKQKIKEIQKYIDKMIADISAKYVLLSGDERAEDRYALRSELKNLYDLKELNTLPDNISDETWETDVNGKNYIDLLCDCYKALTKEENKSEDVINALKSNIREIFNNAGAYQSKEDKIQSYLSQYENSTSKSIRTKLREYLKQEMESFDKDKKIGILNKQIEALTKIKNSLIKERDEYQEQENYEEMKGLYQPKLDEIEAEINEIKGEIEKLEGK